MNEAKCLLWFPPSSSHTSLGKQNCCVLCINPIAGEDKASAKLAFILLLQSSKPVQAHKSHVLCSLVLQCHLPRARFGTSQLERQHQLADVRFIAIFSHRELQQQGGALRNEFSPLSGPPSVAPAWIPPWKEDSSPELNGIWAWSEQPQFKPYPDLHSMTNITYSTPLYKHFEEWNSELQPQCARHWLRLQKSPPQVGADTSCICCAMFGWVPPLLAQKHQWVIWLL